jgi:membrane associated rhomboid family serine protease
VLPLHDNVPTRSFPLVTVGLIVTNAVVWLWELSGGRLERHIGDYSYYPCSVTGSCLPVAVKNVHYWESAFTSMFMHASWAHILGNMLFLWIFGNNVEDAMGHVRFLVFYLAAGLAATALQTYITLQHSSDAGASIPNLGASGAIAGVLGAYALILPFAPVRTFPLFFLRIPAIFFIGLWFYIQLREAQYSLVHPAPDGGVAFFAHIGGFLFGAVTIRFLMVRPPAPRTPRFARG